MNDRGYEALEMEILTFGKEDVIVTSNCDTKGPDVCVIDGNN